MEKTLFCLQAKNRLGGTMLRLGWLIAVCAFVPVLLYGMMFAMAFGAVLRIVILTMFVIITLGAILLNEKFLSLFHMENMEQAEVIVQTTSAAYQTIMPIFLVLSVIFLIGNLLTERKKIVRIFDFFQDEPRLFFKHNFCLLSKTVRGNYITIGTELTEENFRSLRMIRIGRMKA